MRLLNFLVILFISFYSAHAQSLSIKDSLDLNSVALRRIADSERSRYDKERALIDKAASSGLVDDGIIKGEDFESQLKSLSSGSPIYYITDNVNAAISIGANKLHTGGGLGYTLNGQGIQIGEWDGGATLVGHQEFGNRAAQGDNATSLSNHATHVAGTMIASGVQASAKGMAPQASLLANDWNNDNSEMATAASNGLILSNHSYGIVSGWAFGPWATGVSSWHWFGDPLVSPVEDYKFGYYSYNAQVWDQIANNATNYLIVKSAGNDRNDSHSGGHYVWQNGGWSFASAPRNSDGNADGYDCISGEGVSKNVLTIGAVDDVLSYSGASSLIMSSFSGWGPTDDGRVKPDLVANGITLYSTLATGSTSYGTMSGTSMSAPSASGGLALIQQYAYNKANNYLKSAALKGLAIHTAKEAGSAQGPDYQFGWGLLDIEHAVEALDDTLTIFGMHTLSNSLTFSNSLTLSSNPVRITIAWNDPAGTPVTSNLLNNTTSMLVNDLDIRLTAPSGQVYYPYVLNPSLPSTAASTGDNVRDNVEMIDLPNGVVPGVYTLTVSHKGTLASSQEFALIVTGSMPSTAPQTCHATITSAITSDNSQTSVALTASTGVSYLWSDSSTSQVLSAYPDSTTTYTVTVIDQYGCASTASIILTTTPVTFLLDLSTQVVDVLKGVHIAGNFQNWNANTTALNYNTSLGAWEYTREFVIGDTIYYKFINGNNWLDPHDLLLNGCGKGPYSDRWVVVNTVNDTSGVFHLSSCDALPPVNPLTDTLFTCASVHVQLTLPSVLSDIVWNTGDTTQSLSVSGPGMYWVTALYPNGVVIQDTLVVVQYGSPSSILSTIGSASLCPGEEVTLSFDTSYVANLLWVLSQDTTSTIVTSIPGSHYVQYTTNNGCTGNSDTVVVTSHLAPSAELNLPDSTYFCLGDTLTISAELGHSYLWNTGEQNAAIQVVTPGDFWVELTSATGCMTQSDTVSAVMSPGVILPVLFTSYAFAASGDTTNIKMIPFNQAYTYIWSVIGGSIIAGQGGENVDVYWHQGAPGDTSLVQLIVDNASCVDSMTLKIFITDVGIGESISNNFSIYPNPSNTRIFIDGIILHLSPTLFSIFDNLGRKISEGYVNEENSINIENLMEGVYVLHIANVGYSASLGFIVMR